MKVEIQLDPGLEEPVIVLRAPSPTGEVEALVRRLRGRRSPGPSPSIKSGRRCG